MGCHAAFVDTLRITLPHKTAALPPTIQGISIIPAQMFATGIVGGQDDAHGRGRLRPLHCGAQTDKPSESAAARKSFMK